MSGSPVIFEQCEYDFIGIGFGPSNIAIAIAADELSSPLNGIFLEKKNEFSWHPGMLFDDAGMQISFLKDLVTFRNPSSRFSFVNYLFEKNRLESFSNLKTFYPSRRDFTDYLAWCSESFTNIVRYGCDVRSIEPVYDKYGGMRCFKLTVWDGTQNNFVKTRNVIFGLGLTPKFPANIVPGNRIIHGSSIISNLNPGFDESGQNYVVVGGGQSAVEIAHHLHSKCVDSKVTLVFPKFGLVPADDSPFVNQLFSEQSVDLCFEHGAGFTSQLLNLHSSANYGAADPDLVNGLYRKIYEEKVIGKARFEIENLSYVVEAREGTKCVELKICSPLLDKTKVLTADYLICATGFRKPDIRSILHPDLQHAFFDEKHELQFCRNYQLKSNISMVPMLFWPSGSEATHGMASTLLSNLAIRAGQIVCELTRSVKSTS